MKRWLLVLLAVVLLGSFAYAEFNEFIDIPPKPPLIRGSLLSLLMGKTPAIPNTPKRNFFRLSNVDAIS